MPSSSRQDQLTPNAAIAIASRRVQAAGRPEHDANADNVLTADEMKPQRGREGKGRKQRGRKGGQRSTAPARIETIAVAPPGLGAAD